jgi:hypothetical protein
MVKITNFYLSLAILAIGCFLYASCTQPAAGPAASPPTGVMAAATSDSTIVVNWIRNSSDNGADTIIATDTVTGSKIAPVIVLATATPDTIGKLTGLDTGVVYNVSVHSSAGPSSSVLIMTNPPSGLVALALDSADISVGWNRTQGDASADTIVVTPSAGAPVIVPSPNNGPATIPNLSEGIVYSISIHSTAGASIPLQWMTAERTAGIKIYETKDTITSDPKALIFGTHNTRSDSLSGLANADFVLESDSTLASGISLVSGKLFNPAWNVTLIDSSASDHPDYVVGGLDADYTSTNYQADQNNSSANSYDIPDDNSYASTGSRVLIVTTADSHLALVEVVPDVSGTLFSTVIDSTGTYKYITVNVSYQSAVKQPYAARGRSTRSSGPLKRISAH